MLDLIREGASAYLGHLPPQCFIGSVATSELAQTFVKKLLHLFLDLSLVGQRSPKLS